MKITPRPPDARQARGPVEVHIEELVLHGFPPGDRHRIASALVHELQRLIGESGLPGFPENRPAPRRINGGAFKVEAGAKPQAAGVEIARAVFRGLRQHTRASAHAPATRFGKGGVRP
jgi:hypothetical protein